MAKLNGTAVVSVSTFTGGENRGISKKDGLQSVILNPLAGKIPSRRVLAGALAQSAGFVPGAAYIVGFTEGEEQEYENNIGDTVRGRQFNFSNGGKCAPLDVAELMTRWGSPEIINIGDAVMVKKAEDTNAGGAQEKLQLVDENEGK